MVRVPLNLHHFRYPVCPQFAHKSSELQAILINGSQFGKHENHNKNNLKRRIFVLSAVPGESQKANYESGGRAFESLRVHHKNKDLRAPRKS
jgi:hypothetical protein